MKNTAEGVNSRSNDTVEKTIELEDRIMEITDVKQEKRQNNKRNEDNLRDL